MVTAGINYGEVVRRKNMFCKSCGKEIENGSWSCPYCGEIMDSSISVASQSSTEKTSAQISGINAGGQEGITDSRVDSKTQFAAMPEEEHRKQVKRWAVASIILLGASFLSMQLGILLPAFGDGKDLMTALMSFSPSSFSSSAHIFRLFLLLAATAFLCVSLIEHIVRFVQNGKALARFGSVYQKTRREVFQYGIKRDGWREFSGRKNTAPWASSIGAMLFFGFLFNEGNPVAWFTLMFVVLLQLAGCIVEVVVVKKKLNELFAKA